MGYNIVTGRLDIIKSSGDTINVQDNSNTSSFATVYVNGTNSTVNVYGNYTVIFANQITINVYSSYTKIYGTNNTIVLQTNASYTEIYGRNTITDNSTLKNKIVIV